jgi:Predicted metal-dependent hydrolase
VKIYKLILEKSAREIEIVIERKKIKNPRIRVLSDVDVRFSVPFGVSNEWIVTNLEKQSEWINSKVQRFESMKDSNRPNLFEILTEIKTGTNIQYLGKMLTIVIIEAEKTEICIDDNILKLYISKSDMKKDLIKVFDRLWIENTEEIILKLVDKYSFMIEDVNMDKPIIKIRKMKTLWGSCNYIKGKLTFNFYLTRASYECVEYVVLHEMAHFIHHNHSKQFHQLVSKYMPNWREYKAKLNGKI